MSGPVALVAAPRLLCSANSSVAATICWAGTPARRATWSSVNGCRLFRSSSRSVTCRAQKSWSCQLFSRINLSMPASRIASSPGLGCRNTSALRAVSVRRGSITISFIPRCCACFSRFAGLRVSNPTVEMDTSGLPPTIKNTSPLWKGSLPAGHTPRRPAVTYFADWSIVTVEKALGDPNARSQSFNIIREDEVKNAPPPL